jgi:dihydrodipicolinate synthase/N-acetylneuraminate lyase
MIVYKPEITRRYWTAIQAGDHAQAARVVREADMPFFEVLMRCKGGFDAAMHALGELTGIYGRWRRAPYYDLSDAEMEELADTLRRIGVL